VDLTILRRTLTTAVVAVLAAAALVGCASSSGEPRTITVPTDAASIQDAVDQAREGDTVLIEAGVYEESVAISTPGIRLVGASRDGVVIDGGGLRANGIVVTADRVVVANLTVRDHTLNGVLVTGMSDENGGLARGSDGYTRLDPESFPPIQGFAIRGVTASNNGLYGLYAFDAQHGVIEQNYASGHADSGIYVGQCQECDIVVRDNVLEFNAVGYEQANASDSVIVVGNRITRNRVGLTLLSAYQEAYLPLEGGTAAGTLVADNAEAQTPEQADGGWGIGIGLAGVVGSTIVANRVEGNPTAGIVVGTAEDLPPLDNVIEGFTGSDNGVDLWYAATARGPGSGNCAEGLKSVSVRPLDLLASWDCTAPASDLLGEPLDAGEVPPGISFREVVAPPPQPDLDASLIDAAPEAPSFDLSAVAVPSRDLLADRAHP